MSRRWTTLFVVAILVTAGGCGEDGGTEADSPDGSQAAEQTASDAAVAKAEAKGQKRARSLRAWFRDQKMTPSDLYVQGIDAPESMLKVYSITRVEVHGSTVTLYTNMFPKGENKNEFAGACNQVISGYGRNWTRNVEVFGRDDQEHGSWDDEDNDGRDDNTGFMACQSDL